MPDENGLDNRVTALEQWRITQEAWKITKERLDEERHAANLLQFKGVRDDLAETKTHLGRQDLAAGKRDEKVDKVLDIVNRVELKLAGEDGAAKAMDKVAANTLADTNAKRQQQANYIAIGSVISGVIIGGLGIFLGCT